MIESRIINNDELKKYLTGKTFSQKLKALLAFQKENWLMLREGYESLRLIKVKEFIFDDILIKVQFNPGRLTSSSAKVDDDSIRSRKCFLCVSNLPSEQRAVAYNNDYLILSNPFPIFEEHFTIAHHVHKPQAIKESFADMLSLGAAIGNIYTVFYNGPKCGASAPDHLHFQAGVRNYMPLENEYSNSRKKYGAPILQNGHINVWSINDGLRRYYSLESKDPKILSNVFHKFYDILQNITASEDEPKLNILIRSEDKRWIVKIFPRQQHRPSLYYRTDEDRILVSPASVDLGGILILPREEDFDKINQDLIRKVFQEVMITEELSGHLNEILRDEIKL